MAAVHVRMCRALEGDEAAAVAAAAAVECAVAAIDVVDDLIDDEWTSCAQDRPRALNASVALAFLAQHCAARAAGALGPERVLLIQAILSEGAVGVPAPARTWTSCSRPPST